MDSLPPASKKDIARWIQIPVGLVLSAFILLCLLGSVSLMVDHKPNAPVLAPLLGALMTLACLWLLSMAMRLLLGKRKSGGLMGPRTLRLVGWLFLLIPVTAILSGSFFEHTVRSLVMTAAYVSIFFAVRRLASQREAAAAGNASLSIMNEQFDDPVDGSGALPINSNPSPEHGPVSQGGQAVLWGASDRMICCQGIEGEGDEFNVSTHPLLQDGGYVATLEIAVPGEPQGLFIHAFYSGHWSFAVSPSSEATDTLPDWPISRAWGTKAQHSETLTIQCPHGAQVRVIERIEANA